MPTLGWLNRALSASRRIATIFSSVNLFFFMGSSLVGGSHSLRLRSVL